MFKNTWFLLLSCIFAVQNCVHGSIKNEIELIGDFLEIDPSKNIVVRNYVCWQKEYKVELLKKLLYKSYFSSVLEMNESFIENLYTNFKQTFILDIDCTNYLNIISKANKERMFSTTYTWLLLSRNPNILKEINDNLIHFDIYPNSNVILVQKNKGGNYLLREIYKYNKNNTEFIINIIYIWRNNNKFGNINQRIIANQRQNLNKTIIASSFVVLHNDTLNHLDDYRDKHIDTASKLNIVFLRHLIDYVNCTMIFYPLDTWGYINKTTNKYNGMINSLDTGESEIGGTTLFMIKERLLLVDYIAMTTPVDIQFIFRQPPLSFEKNIFTLPFTRGLWLSTFCLIVIAILLLYSTVFWEWTEPNLEIEPDALRNSFLDVVMLTFAAVAQQGSTFQPRSGAGKIIMIFTFISLMFLYVSYSANIVALLQSYSTNTRTLKDLLESRMKIGSDDTSFNRFYMSEATEPIRKALYEKKIAPRDQKPNFISMEEGVKRMREGFYAFHMELPSGYKIISDTFYENEKCGLQEIRFLDYYQSYLPVKKHSVYKEIFTLGLRKIQESGIQNRELSIFHTKKPKCHSAGGNFISVGLVESYPAFLFLGAGIGLSIVLFILENILSRRQITNKICLNINK